MACEPDVALVMMASGSLDTIVTNETSVIFHLPDYKTISATMQHQKLY